jgi:NAD-dependent dihydropyrimidine dehydrogenase PreA subunit
VCCDGSAKYAKGAFSWIVASDNKPILRFSSTITGNPLTPFRTECVGFLSVFTFLEALCKHKNIQSTSQIFTYTNCKKVLPYISTEPLHYKHKNPLQDDYDASNATHIATARLSTLLPGLQAGQHVKAHQQINAESPWEVRLNQLCDSAAKERREQCNPETAQNTIDTTIPHLCFNNKPVTSNTLKTAQTAWRNTIVKEYYKGKLKLSTAQLSEVNWRVHSKIHRNVPQHMHQFLVKLNNKWLAVGKRREMYGSNISECHRCKQPETYSHLFQCPHDTNEQEKFLHELNSFLTSIKTSSHIQRPLMEGITRYFYSEEHDDSILGEEAPIHPDHPYIHQNRICGR